MNRILDNSLVGLALLASAGYALSSLGPKGLRRRLWTTLARLTARAPAFLRLAAVTRRLEAAAAAGQNSGACGGCGSCGSEPSMPDQPPSSDVRVPLAKLGRRD